MHPVKELRAYSSDRVGGTPVQVALRDTARLWPASEEVGWRYGGFPLSTIERALRGGAVVVVGGDYEELPLHYRRWTYNDKFDHAVAIKFLLHDGRTRMYDPLGGGRNFEPYDGEWIALDRMFGGYDQYAWHKSNDTFYVGIVQNRERGAPMKLHFNKEFPSNHRARFKDKTPVFKRPNLLQAAERFFWKEENWHWLMGKTANNWHIVAYKGTLSGEWKIGYVQGNDKVDEEVRPWPDTDEVTDADYNTLIEANKQLITSNQALKEGNEDFTGAMENIQTITNRYV